MNVHQYLPGQTRSVELRTASKRGSGITYLHSGALVRLVESVDSPIGPIWKVEKFPEHDPFLWVGHVPEANLGGVWSAGLPACPDCGGPWVSRDCGGTTLVGYSSPSGHDHDDNCTTYSYACSNGHHTEVSRIPRCGTEACSWVGKETCFCSVRVPELPELSLLTSSLGSG